ncbi:MAG: hypothetical protein ACT4OM_03710 [Actinomycetota bacterium]
MKSGPINPNLLSRILSLLAALMLALIMFPAAPSAASLGGNAGPKVGANREFVLVADPLERKVFVYRVPGLQLTGVLHDVGLGVPGTGANVGLGSATHSGTIILPGGRILTTDDVKQEILEIRVDALGRPAVARRVAAELPDDGAWSAVDPAFRYFAVSSGKDDSTGIVNLVDLATFRNTVTEFPLSLPEEVHPYLVGSPPSLFVSLGGKIQSFKVSDLLKGIKAPTSEVVVGTGSHGSFVSARTSTVGIVTDASLGLDVIKVACGRIPRLLCPNPTLETKSTIPWAADGLSGGRNARPRLTNDGGSVLGVASAPAAGPALWPEVRNDVHVADLLLGTARRFTMGLGVSSRFANSNDFAVFSTVHPDGDKLRLLNVRPRSANYLEFAGEVALAPMTNGPVAGQSTAGKERRFVAVTPRGGYAFASHGGDGKVTMVDTRTLGAREFSVPTPLKGGGYLVGIDLGFVPADLVGR